MADSITTDICELLIKGYSSKDISKCLGISEYEINERCRKLLEEGEKEYGIKIKWGQA